MIVLGIETSCDETAVAIVNEKKEILSNQIISQIDIHQAFGGVVPELAARSHIDVIDKLIAEAFSDAKITLQEIDAIAVTAGPGLIGGLIVGVMIAKSLALALNKPLIAINHLEGHLLTCRLTSEIEFPFLTLLISGGHCQILRTNQVSDYHLIGQTIDDALGESFDKVAQMIGDDYPGGPKIEKRALSGDENRFKLPKPLIASDYTQKNIYNFSFSGLKTAVRRLIEKLTNEEFTSQSYLNLSEQEKNDISASFQKTVCEIIINRLQNVYQYHDDTPKKLVICGGVSANKYIFNKLEQFCQQNNIEICNVDIKLSTDNACMIAWAGIERLKLGYSSDQSFKPRAKWPLQELNN